MKNKNVMKKLYTICILSAVSVCCLVFLLASGRIESIVTAPKETTAVTTATPSASAEASAVPTATAVTIDTESVDSIQKVINQAHMISEDYVPSDLVAVSVSSNNEQMMRKEAADELTVMFQDAETAGIHLYLISGYRDYALQVSLEQYYINQMGADKAALVDDHPGASEHQLGLAADLGVIDQACELQECFAQSNAYQWLMDNSYKYGYILRYQDGKTDITGIEYSPWHYRYIGKEEAEKVYISGLSLEEYYQVSNY